MARCDHCGEHESLPYNCRYCGGQFCSAHRLPENHDCPGLEQAGTGGGVFDSGLGETVDDRESKSVLDRVGIDTSIGGPLAYIRGNVTYVVLLVMWLTFLAQWLAIAGGGQSLHQHLFVLSADRPLAIWTWITSIFAHDPVNIFHILFNSIVIFFFGPLVERYVGSRRFGALFVVSGVIAGLSQIGLDVIGGTGGPGVLGASGAALAILGVLTVFNPSLRVYLFFALPMSIWILTGGIAVISAALIIAGSPGAGGIAHAAHLAGLLVGLAYGTYEARRIDPRTPQQFHLGGGRPPRRRL